MSRTAFVYFLNERFVSEYIDARHRTHAWVAKHLGLSRSYWSQLVRGTRPLSPATRLLLVTSDFFRAVPESDLWERRPRAALPVEN